MNQLTSQVNKATKRPSNPTPQLPSDLAAEINRLRPGANSLGAAEAFWKRLEPPDRNRLKQVQGELELTAPLPTSMSPLMINAELFIFLRAFGSPVAMYQALNGVSEAAAVVELTEMAGGLMPGDAEHLRQRVAVAERVAPVEPRTKPRWDPQTGELWFAGCVVRSVSPHGKSWIPVILQAFEKSGWQTTIDNPIDAKNPGEALRNTLSELNKRIAGKVIRFHSVDNGKRIRWTCMI